MLDRTSHLPHPFQLLRRRHPPKTFDEQGLARPVTVIEAGPCVVTQLRSSDKDGYEAVQLGYGIAKKLTTNIIMLSMRNRGSV